MAIDIIYEGDFHDGFEVGYRLIKGINCGMPGIPGHGGILGNSTEFLEGIKAGIKAAGKSL